MTQLIKILSFALVVLCLAQCKSTEVATAEKAMDDKVMETKEMMDDKMDKVTDFRSSPPEAGPAPKINIGTANTFKLDNGLQVIVSENHKIPSVSFQVSLKNEQILEYDKVGYVSMAGDLMGRGTTTKSKAEIDEAVDFIGANFNTFGSGMFGSSLTKHMPALLDIMTDVLYNPSMPAAELEKIKTQTLTGLEAGKTDPNSISANMRARVMYGANHPYGEIQTEDNVKAIDIDACRKYVDDFFIPNNAYLVIVGDITVDVAKDVANKYFGNWERKPFKPVRHRAVPDAESTQVQFANKDGAVQSVVNVSYPIDMKPNSPDVIPARVMNTILGGGFSGRLNLNLREDKAYTYGAGSNVSSDRLAGSFNASASVRNEVTDSSITQILYELDLITKEPVDAEVLQNTKNFMTGGFARSLESPQTIARFALNRFRNNLPDDYYETYLEKLNAVTVEDIQAMAKKYIRPEAAHIFVVGSKDEVAETLMQFDGDGDISYYDSFGEVMVPDATEIPDGLTGKQVVEDYIAAIGGMDKLKSIKSVKTTLSTALMGQNMTMVNTYADGKFAMSMGNGQMTFMEQKYNGEKLEVSQMGASQVITEGPQLEAIKGQATVSAQFDYLSNGSTIELLGAETIDGVSCYKVAVTKPSGDKVTEFYSVDNSLLLRTVATAPGPAGETTITTDMQDYKTYDGFMMPSLLKIAGMMPTTVEMKVESIDINGAVDMSMFDIK